MYLVKYQRSDGLIVGLWSANMLELLEPNRVLDDPLYGYVTYSSPASPHEVEEQSRVTAGAVVPKTAATITCTPATFAADGVAEAVITVTPFAPCTLLVDGQGQVLTTGDPILQLTSDIPHIFQLALAPHAEIWAPARTVEAL
jgi:hypothetical protein